MHTHRSVMATCVHGAAWRSGGGREGVTLSTLPYFHVTGMQGAMNGPIFVGSCIVLMTRWDRRTAAKLIERYRVTSWTNIVTMAIDLLSDPDVESFDLSSLENIGGGGAAMPEAVSDKLFKLTGLRYIEGYGLSETIAATHINPSEKPKKQCLGIPVFDVDSRVIDVDTGKEMGVGEVGEIISRGPQIFQGYWNRPLETCVISAPHERRGETVKACVVLAADHKGKVSEDEIIAWCKEQMAAYKVPQIVEFRDELPRSPTGKVMWRAMQEEEWADQQQQA
jgi:fatty-acyl-CoA synthase